MEGFLDGLVNGFWQCPGFDDDTASAVGSTTSTISSSTMSRQSCKNIFAALMTESTERMEFQFVQQNNNNNNNTSNNRSSRQQRSSHQDDDVDVVPPLPSSSSSRPSNPAAKKAVGKMFKRIRVKRGENIGMELFEHAKSVYISRVAKDGTGLKRGMRIIAINDHPCPDSVGEAIELLSLRSDDENGAGAGYVTFVTGEEYDFENAPSVVVGGEHDNHSDSYSIRSSTGYV